jgi:dCMP deaminase
MPTKYQTDTLYMNCAIEYSKLSKAHRAKVGAVLVTTLGVMIGGVNGLPNVLGNDCEDGVWDGDEFKYFTKPEVIHSELNCLLRAAREGVSVLGSTIYVTLSPCVHCASMLLSAGVKRVVYLDKYRDTSGISVLELGCCVEKYKQ